MRTIKAFSPSDSILAGVRGGGGGGGGGEDIKIAPSVKSVHP